MLVASAAIPSRERSASVTSNSSLMAGCRRKIFGPSRSRISTSRIAIALLLGLVVPQLWHERERQHLQRVEERVGDHRRCRVHMLAEQPQNDADPEQAKQRKIETILRPMQHHEQERGDDNAVSWLQGPAEDGFLAKPGAGSQH